jgi:hypothetical protein
VAEAKRTADTFSEGNGFSRVGVVMGFFGFLIGLWITHRNGSKEERRAGWIGLGIITIGLLGLGLIGVVITHLIPGPTGMLIYQTFFWLIVGAFVAWIGWQRVREFIGRKPL